jgi:hypothetical protein
MGKGFKVSSLKKSRSEKNAIKKKKVLAQTMLLMTLKPTITRVLGVGNIIT